MENPESFENPESIAGIVFSPDRSSVLLILRRDVPVWVLPGGGIEPGEKPEQATLREILEETGLSVKMDRLVGRYYPINRLAKQTLLYECSTIGGSISISDETRDVRFFPLNKLPPMPPPYNEWINDALVIQAPVTKKLTSVNYSRLILEVLKHPILVARFFLARMGLSVNSKD